MNNSVSSINNNTYNYFSSILNNDIKENKSIDTENQRHESNFSPVSAKNSNFQLENIWNNLLSMNSEKTNQLSYGESNPIPDADKVKIPYSLNSSDSFKSRGTKAEYSSAINAMRKELNNAQELKNDINNVKKLVNGKSDIPENMDLNVIKDGDKTTVRIKNNNSSDSENPGQANDQWQEYTYSDDGNYMSKTQHKELPNGKTKETKNILEDNTYKTSVNGEEMSALTFEDASHMKLSGKNAPTFELNGSDLTMNNRNSLTTYKMNENGDLVKKSGTGTQVAASDGSYRQITYDENGNEKIKEVAPGTGPNPGTNMEVYEKYADEMGSFLKDDGKTSKLSDDQRYALASALSRFDPGLLENIKNSDVKYIIANAEKTPDSGYPVLEDEKADESGKWMQKWPDQVGGIYSYPNNTISLRKEDLENGGSFEAMDTIRHETGHAIDDILISDWISKAGISSDNRSYTMDPSNQDTSDRLQVEKMSDSYPQLQDMQKAYKERVKEAIANNNPQSSMWSPYAFESPKTSEYFAEGVKMFTGNENMKNTLKQMDPELYEFVKTTIGMASIDMPQFEDQANNIKFPAAA